MVSTAEVASEDVLQVLCLDTADNLIILNLSPDPTVHKAAQTVVRQAFPDAESRADCFRYLLQSSGDLSLRGLVRFLGSFVQAASTMVEANDLAKWMVRSFADIVEVLCSSTDGLLRPGTPFSLVDDQNSRRAVQAQLPDLWRLMCQSVSEIFKRTPSWATLLARDELVAWFRDVTIFASELVDQVSTFELAMRTGRRERMKQITDDEGDMVQDLALPLENTMTWLRMNDQEILGAVVDFINKTLDRFQDSNVDLPEGKERLLSFIEIQLQEPNESKRQTLLSAEQLTDLKHRLLGTVIITDGSEEEDLPTEVAPPPSSSQPFWESIGTPQKASPASQERKRKLKQQKLSFAKATPSAVIDVDALPDRQASKSAAASSSATNRVAPRPTIADKVAASASLNKFKAATSSSTSSSVASKQPAVRPGGKVSQLRQEFASTRQWKPTNVNQRAPVRRPSPVNEVEPRAPAAVSSVTGAFAGKKPPMQPAASRQAAASDSSDSSSSDDEPETRGLQSLVKDQKSPIKMRFKPTKPVQRRTILMEEDPARLRALREKQEAERKRRLRSAPDFSGLHRSILAWDFYHEGEQPPAVAPVQYVSVPNTFTSPSHYGSIFGPLLFLECWAQFQQAKEEMERDRSTVQVIPVDITGRSTVDSFIDVTATIPPNAILPSFYFADTDIVFLRERPDPGVPRPARPRIVLAKVQAFKKHPQGHQLTLRCFLAEDRQGVSSTLTNRSKWELGKLFTLTTLNREFAALSTAEYYDLIPDVLAARAAKKVVLPADEVKKAMSAYQVNEPQASAILGSLRTQGFAMIQGPPGTGKTKTICGLVGAFISTRRAPTTSVQAGRPQAQSAAGPSKKMLVCAPSNAAIDEVAKRVKAGMRDASGKMVYPKVVRIGNDNAINVSVKDIALDNLVDERMGAAGPTTDTSALHAEIRSLRDAREKKQTELSQVKNNPALVSQLEAEIRNLSSQRMAVMARLDEAKDKQQSTARQQDADRRRHRHDVLFEADVICSTLAGAGHEMLNQLPFDFETVVIDEAAQAVELSALIPLRYGCQRCILVGGECHFVVGECV